MEYLGYTHSKPTLKKNGKWNYLDVEYNTLEEFNDATAKMLGIMYKSNSDGKCIVMDGKGNKYLLELIHSTYDTINRIIRVLPYNCQVIVEDEKDSSKSTKTKSKKPTE